MTITVKKLPSGWFACVLDDNSIHGAASTREKAIERCRDAIQERYTSEEAAEAVVFDVGGAMFGGEKEGGS